MTGWEVEREQREAENKKSSDRVFHPTRCALSSRPPPFSLFPRFSKNRTHASTNASPLYHQRARPGPGGQVRRGDFLRDGGKSLSFFVFLRARPGGMLAAFLSLLDPLSSLSLIFFLPSTLPAPPPLQTRSWPCASSSRRWSGGRRRTGAPTSWCRCSGSGWSRRRSRRGERSFFLKNVFFVFFLNDDGKDERDKLGLTFPLFSLSPLPLHFSPRNKNTKGSASGASSALGRSTPSQPAT